MSTLIDENVSKLTAIMNHNDVCPNCKTERYFDPNMVIVVSDCFHKMCQSCVDRLYGINSAQCPFCDKMLRKTSFSPMTFEDLSVEKEVRIRKRISQIYNKLERDFDSRKEYDDYLEEVEDIIYNLFNNIDIEATEEKIKTYEKENKKIIEYNKKLKISEDQAFKMEQEEEKKRRLENKNAYIKEIDEEEKQRKAQKDELIDELVHSTESADKIIKKHDELEKKRQKVGYAASIMGRSNKGSSIAYKDLSRFQQGYKQEIELYDPTTRVFLPNPTKSTLLPEYVGIGFKASDKVREIASAGGFTLHEYFIKSVKSIHFGALQPLDLSKS